MEFEKKFAEIQARKEEKNNNHEFSKKGEKLLETLESYLTPEDFNSDYLFEQREKIFSNVFDKEGLKKLTVFAQQIIAAKDSFKPREKALSFIEESGESRINSMMWIHNEQSESNSDLSEFTDKRENKNISSTPSQLQQGINDFFRNKDKMLEDAPPSIVSFTYKTSKTS